MSTRLSVEDENLDLSNVVIVYQITSRHFVSVHKRGKPHRRSLTEQLGLDAVTLHITCQFLLFVLPAIGSAKATEIVWLSFGCFKHTNGDEYTGEQDCVDRCAYAENQD